MKDVDFVFVVPFFNCAEDIEKTIYSMVAQSYPRWRAVLINDMSTDDSMTVVRNTIEHFPDKLRSKFTLVDNETKHGEVKNTLEAVKTIDDDDIVCRLDGGDWLTENDLLYVLASVYQDTSIAVAWTAHRWSYTSQNISGPLVLSHDRTVYQHPWVSSHLKTFKCGALKKVPDANFRDDAGDYIMIACDQAIFLPMMHVAHHEGKKLMFVPILGYHYSIDLENKSLFTSDRSYRQKMSAEAIRARGFIE